MLFRPVNVGTWFSFGLIFFLQSCMEGGGSGGGNFSNLGDLFKQNGGHRRYGQESLSSIAHAFDLTSMHGDYFNGGVLLVVGAIALVVGVPLALLAMWLGARGRMMAIRAVATGRAPVSEHWEATRASAWSFMKFQLVLGLIAGVFVIPVAVGILYFTVFSADFEADPLANLGIVIGLVGILLLLSIPAAIVSSLARNFVAPIMLKKEISFAPAWREFMGLARGNWGKIVVFWFLRLGFSVAAAVVAMLVTVFTCCIGALPVVNQTLMAPYYAFERAHTLFILQSIGAEYNLIEAFPDDGPGGYGGGPGGYGGYGQPGASPYGPYGGPVPPAGGFGAQNPPYS